jgi:hypothetical protein
MKIVVIGLIADLHGRTGHLRATPGDRHAVSANARKTKPVKLLAVFVVTGAKPGAFLLQAG